ncbi:hypothetical protein FACS1894182_13080 [Bacteroidia bacterium]|nr:hypothetical protein FACS1894182_13080 [Bacteroidia bacterium]
MKHNIIGIRRENLFSPNRVKDDAAVFNRVSELLRQKGCEITEYEESAFRNATIGDGLIFNMARDMRTVWKLQQLEDAGRTVINSGYGIENCTRGKMTRLLLDNNVPYPKSKIIPTAEADTDLSDIGPYCWIKRGDYQAILSEDVIFSRAGKESAATIREYSRRNISSVVVNEHLKGDLIKFYGVPGTDFFYWLYPDRLNYSKFGLETINGKPQGIPFDADRLKILCTHAAQVLNIVVYGGDAIVDLNGIIRIIDLNDWPSFAPCLELAAPYIAQYIYGRL